MKRWLTSLFLLLALAGGLPAATPLHSGSSNSRMKCCKKTREAKQTPQMKKVCLCCVMNCSNTTPTPSGTSFNFSPSGIIISDSLIKQITSLLLIKQKTDSTSAISFQHEIPLRKIPPKYIQHHSILI